MNSARLQPAFYGGLFTGVVSALPFVSDFNVCCCCIWAVVGGLLAAYLRQQNSPYAVTAAEGALVGLTAGAIGAVISAVLSIPLAYLTGPMQQQIIERLISSNPDMSAELRDVMQRATGPGMRVVGMFINLVFFTIFGLLGGLLGTAMFKKNAAPPPPGTVEVLPPE